jgi:toxin ParE1/3/4
MARIARTPRAEVDVLEIWTYISRDSKTQADRLVERIDKTLRLLSMQPQMGQHRPELAPELRSFSVGNYVVFFRPIDDGIEVERVIHAARDVNSII